MNRQLSKEKYIEMVNKHMEYMFNIISHQKNANQKDNEVSLYSHWYRYSENQ